MSRIVRAAAIQISPVLGDDGLGTARKVCQAIRDAAEKGVTLAVFPETFVPYYPIFPLSSQPSGLGASIWNSMSAPLSSQAR